jgi:hypothetical protein
MTQAVPSKRDQSPARRAPEAREESVGGLQRGARVCARRPLQRAARVGQIVLQVVGHLHQGDGVGATGGKGGEGLASDYFMMRIGIPNGISPPASCASSAAHAQVRAQPGRHHRAPGHSASLAHHRIAARSRRCARRHRPLAQGRLRRRGAQRDRLPAGRRGRR